MKTAAGFGEPGILGWAPLIGHLAAAAYNLVGMAQPLG